MWIKQIKKSNSPKGKTFLQYQLTETYRVNRIVKHKHILYLGYHQLLENKTNRQHLSKLLENLIKGTPYLSEEFTGSTAELTQLAEAYYRKYLLKQKDELSSPAQHDNKESDRVTYDLINTASTEVFDSREIGAEWMCYSMLNRLGLKEFLSRRGWSGKWIDYAHISIISRAVACFSEHKTQDWLKNNSALTELFTAELGEVTRHHLYKVSDMLNEIKDDLESFFYNRVTDIFGLSNSLIIYDLTNTYFEGRKVGSRIAHFGRSKEKRYDCKQVVLAAVINEHGFLKHSQILEGNVSDPATLDGIITGLQKQHHQPISSSPIVLDAGIATEANLAMLRKKGIKYICVSRSKLKDFEAEIQEGLVEIRDKRDNPIELKLIKNTSSDDQWMYVKSKGKNKKESSMVDKSLERFDEELQAVRNGIDKKGGTKKVEKVWERIGRIKERNKRAHKYYDLELINNGKIVTQISWRKKPVEEEQTQTGVYFLRTNYALQQEEQLWQVYNTIREVESTFRCLKTDLNLRPVFHQKDQYVDAHLHLGLLAYQLVAPVRYMLKQHDLHYDWRNIVRIMNTQKAVSVRQESKSGQIIIRSCSRPSQQALGIYKALNIKSIPYANKKFVVTH